MYRWEVMAALADQRVLGIVRTSTAEEATRRALQLLGAGLRCVEVAFTTPGAVEALRAVAAQAPEGAVVGAGTILDPADAAAAVGAGARFLVAPELRPAVVRAAHHHGVPVLPGVGTVTEARTALRLGADAVKLFPASPLGPAWLRDVRAALPRLPVVPTGGVTAADVPEWLAAGAVSCGIGSWLTATDDVGTRVRELLTAAGRGQSAGASGAGDAGSRASSARS
ncbi:MAG TPA: bifunctional 4-hydroxy-2-oxoglutarate aldolase/2-dehydro-3-deoxy-phosphogluconate aldolase [Kineosporiaceae bacterium]|nr:bifunctional 4-hydroxy-2-oxoglutarate aldolase/2-dehydro-3-deoxy-phosphogluconate aldolase [Kineosporiaceae bacterium]